MTFMPIAGPQSRALFSVFEMESLKSSTDARAHAQSSLLVKASDFVFSVSQNEYYGEYSMSYLRKKSTKELSEDRYQSRTSDVYVCGILSNAEKTQENKIE